MELHLTGKPCGRPRPTSFIRKSAIAQRRSFRPVLEMLEDRLCPSTLVSQPLLAVPTGSCQNGAVSFRLVPGEGPVNEDSSHTFFIQALDGLGNPATRYTNIPVFAGSTDPNAVAGAVTQLGGGSFSVSVTFSDPGPHPIPGLQNPSANLGSFSPSAPPNTSPQTIEFKDPTDSTIFGSSTVEVGPPDPGTTPNVNGVASYGIEVPDDRSFATPTQFDDIFLQPGVPFSATIYALGVNGLPDAEAANTIKITASPTIVGLPETYTFTPNDHGVHTFAGVTDSATIDTDTITATDTANALVTGSNTVNAGFGLGDPYEGYNENNSDSGVTQQRLQFIYLIHNTLTPIASNQIAAGQMVDLLVQGLTSGGVPDPTYTGQLVVTSSDATLPVDDDGDNDGDFTVSEGSRVIPGVVFHHTGVQEIHALDTGKVGGVDGFEADASIQVLPGALDSFRTEVVPLATSTTTAGAPFSVRVIALDTEGNVKTDYGSATPAVPVDGSGPQAIQFFVLGQSSAGFTLPGDSVGHAYTFDGHEAGVVTFPNSFGFPGVAGGTYTLGVVSLQDVPGVEDADDGIFGETQATYRPEPSVTPPANQTAVEGIAKQFNLGSFVGTNQPGPWTVDVKWGDTVNNLPTPDTTFTVSNSGPLPPATHTYLEESHLAPYTVTVNVTDAAGISGCAT